jgi:K+-transporting ATPase KdpF subunit
MPPVRRFENDLILGGPLARRSIRAGHCGVFCRIVPEHPGGGEAVIFFDFLALALAAAAAVYLLVALIRPERF